MIPTCGYLRKQKAVMKRYLFENSMMSFSFYVSVFLDIEIDISDVFVVHVFYNTSLLRNISNIKSYIRSVWRNRHNSLQIWMCVFYSIIAQQFQII